MSEDGLMVVFIDGAFVYPPTLDGMRECLIEQARRHKAELIEEQMEISAIIRNNSGLAPKHWKRSVYLRQRIEACVRILMAMESLDDA